MLGEGKKGRLSVDILKVFSQELDAEFRELVGPKLLRIAEQGDGATGKVDEVLELCFAEFHVALKSKHPRSHDEGSGNVRVERLHLTCVDKLEDPLEIAVAHTVQHDRVVFKVTC